MKTCCLWIVLFAPAPEPPPVEPGPVEIDFAPLLATKDYKLHVHAVSGKAVLKTSTFAQQGISAAAVRDLWSELFESADWKVKEVGETVLIVEGKDGKGVKSLEIRLEGLPKECAPVVRRPKQPPRR